MGGKFSLPLQQPICFVADTATGLSRCRYSNQLYLLPIQQPIYLITDTAINLIRCRYSNRIFVVADTAIHFYSLPIQQPISSVADTATDVIRCRNSNQFISVPKQQPISLQKQQWSNDIADATESSTSRESLCEEGCESLEAPI